MGASSSLALPALLAWAASAGATGLAAGAADAGSTCSARPLLADGCPQWEAAGAQERFVAQHLFAHLGFADDDGRRRVFLEVYSVAESVAGPSWSGTHALEACFHWQGILIGAETAN